MELTVNDIYYQEDYIKLYLKPLQKIVKFEFSDATNQFYHITIQRPIYSVNSELQIYDLETAYGYGGFWCNTDNRSFIRRALNAYDAFCKEKNIVAEFFSFHPFNRFPEFFNDYFDFLVEERKTVYVNLQKAYETIYQEYHPSLRRNLKKAQKNKLQFLELLPTPQNIFRFYQLYFATMKKNNADSFYFFPEAYFKQLFELPEAKLYGVEYEGKIVNMVVMLESTPFCYYHLGASDPQYYSLNGNPFLFDQLIQRYQKTFTIFYLGGGATPDPEDSLLRFKRKFSPETTPFFIAGKIYNKTKYDDLVKEAEQKCPELSSVNYFLKYRLCKAMNMEETC